MRIWIYISGNLAAESMFMLATHLSQVYPDFHYFFITDGFTPTLYQPQKQQLILVDSLNNLHSFKQGDILLTGIMTPGENERRLISMAKQCNCVTIAFLNDIGGSAMKFYEKETLILPDFIVVADVITYKNLIKEGIPKSIILQMGSIYLDSIRNLPTAIKTEEKNMIGYLSVPNTDDAKIWGHQLEYSEVELANDIVNCMEKSKKYILTIRKHPKEYKSTKYNFLICGNITIEDHDQSSIEDFIDKHSLLISSYSTALLVAVKMGRRAISYQPGKCKPLRVDLYSMIRIPIATNIETLEELLEYDQSSNLTVDSALYNPGNTLFCVTNFLHNRIFNLS